MGSKTDAVRKKAAGLGLLAVSLAACNSDDDTPFAQSDIDVQLQPLISLQIMQQQYRPL